MQFYTFELDEKSKELCTIATPFGNYRYNRVPMGLKISPAFAQAKMEQCLQDIEELDVYIDDVGIFTGDWSQHLESLDNTPSPGWKTTDSQSTLSSASGLFKRQIG